MFEKCTGGKKYVTVVVIVVVGYGYVWWKVISFILSIIDLSNWML